MKIKGISASPGVATGKIFLYTPTIPPPVMEKISPQQITSQIKKYDQKREKAKEELNNILAHLTKIGSSQADIFMAHIELLCDEILYNEVTTTIAQQLVSAKMAVHSTYTGYAAMLAKTKNLLLRERATDIKDVRNRLICHLSNVETPSIPQLAEPFIIVASELFPSDTALLTPSHTLGIIAEKGNANCHTALLANSHGIPAILGADNATKLLRNGQMVLLNATEGTAMVNPSPLQIAQAQ